MGAQPLPPPPPQTQTTKVSLVLSTTTVAITEGVNGPIFTGHIGPATFTGKTFTCNVTLSGISSYPTTSLISFTAGVTNGVSTFTSAAKTNFRLRATNDGITRQFKSYAAMITWNCSDTTVPYFTSTVALTVNDPVSSGVAVWFEEMEKTGWGWKAKAKAEAPCRQ